MPTKPPHQVSSQESQNPDSPRSVGPHYAKQTQLPPRRHSADPAVPPIMQNKPNYRAANMQNEADLPSRQPNDPPIMRNKPNYRPAARIHDPNTRNEPNFIPTSPKKCETNPIYPPQDPNMRNEPNLPHHLQSTIYNIQSPGPISAGFGFFPDLGACKCAKQTQSGYHACPHCAKQTQFPYRPHLAGFPTPHCAKQTQFHKANCQNPTANSQKMRNEPNSRIPTVPPPPISAKRTQSLPGNYAKQTQSTVPPASRCPRSTQMRKTNPISIPPAPLMVENEPNLPSRQPNHPPLCKTNPIYHTTTLPIMRNKPNRRPPTIHYSLYTKFPRLSSRLTYQSPILTLMQQ